MTKQDAPFTIQIELVEGCNLRCSFCGLNGIRGKENDYKLLSMTLVNEIVGRIKNSGWNPRIEFAMHGEPSVHTQIIKIMRLFRLGLPKMHLMITSNGIGFLKDTTRIIDGLLSSVNVLALDKYEGIAIVDKILKNYKGNHTPIYYPENKRGNPHKRRKATVHDFVIVRDIAQATSGTHSMLNSHCGAGSEPATLDERCAKPFRELSIRWDGNVSLCCNDFRGIFKIGNILNYETIEELWQDEKFVAARRFLYAKDRSLVPCNWCNARSYRTGLLPDKYGRETLPEPTARDREIVSNCVSGDSYTLPILREWEKQGDACIP